MIISNNELETQNLAGQVAKKIKKGGFICLFGDLGSGKTTFTKGLAHALKINKFSVKSPTYTYIREYKNTKNHLYHIDLYRLEEIDDLLAHEIEEISNNKKNIIIIEWADKMKNYLPKNRIDIEFEYKGENKRGINIRQRY